MKSKSTTSRDIIKKLERHRSEIQRYGVKKIGLFGSFSKGRQKNSSDLDFLVTFSNTTFDNYIELKFFLEKLFRRKVDLVIEENLKPAIKYVKKEALYASIV